MFQAQMGRALSVIGINDGGDRMSALQLVRRGVQWLAILLVCASTIGLSACSDEDKLTALAACRMKAVDAVGPMPPPCIKDAYDPNYPACKKESADKITLWEYQYSPYVDDCMRVAGYRIATKCHGSSAILRERADCWD
jgi:hypothetical protein